jgi:thiol-disulfide isomerase/thioredoxin
MDPLLDRHRGCSSTKRGLTVRVVACLMMMACVCLGPAGCALFGKKNGDGGDHSSPAQAGKAPSKFPTGDPLFPGTAKAAEDSVLLAGRVVDTFNNRPTNAYIRYVCLEDGKETAAPIEVASTDGYFTIPGLKPGATYKLTARTQQGDRLMAGVTYTTAPNPRVIIRLSDDQAGASTPPIPAAPAFQGAREPKTSTQDSKRTPVAYPAERPASAWVPVTPGTPPLDPTLSGSPPAPPNWVPGIAADKSAWSPTIQIPAQTPSPLPAVPELAGPNAAAGGDYRARALGPARVPSCALVGKQLVNFALYDVNGGAWEYKTNRRGKLVFLDFWGTHCVPCLQGLPYLRDLSNKYSASGLEVIGIACEAAGSPQEQALDVSRACRKMQINYRQLLSSGAQCPVRDQFKIHILPTHILVDQQGWILWRHEGRLNELDREQLDSIIRRRLANQ